MEIRDNQIKGCAWAMTQNSLVLEGLRAGRNFQEIMNSFHKATNCQVCGEPIVEDS